MTDIIEQFIRDHLADTLSGIDLSFLGRKTSGKVREIYEQTDGDEDQLIIITTDRLSAFDRVLRPRPIQGPGAQPNWPPSGSNRRRTYRQPPGGRA